MAERPDLIRVLVADDDGAIRDAICDLVALEADMEIVGVAPDAENATALVQRLQPDVALLDVKMFGGGGGGGGRAAEGRPPSVEPAETHSAPA